MVRLRGRRTAWDTMGGFDNESEPIPHPPANHARGQRPVKALLVNSSDDVDRRILLAERDAARRDRTVAELQADLARITLKLQLSELEVAEAQRQIGRLEDQLGLLFSSVSWRWGAPLRRIAGVAGRLRAALGGPPPTVLPAPAPPKQAEEAPAPLSLREQAILSRLHRPG